MVGWLRRLRARIRYRAFDDDLRRELDVHRAMSEDEHRARGVSSAAARSGASRAMGNIALAREASRAVWIAPWLESVWQDLTFACRGLVREPAFTISAGAALVVGIGLNLSLFTVANGLLLRPWPVPDADRVVCVFAEHASAHYGIVSTSISPTEFRFLRDHATTVDLESFGMHVVRIEDDTQSSMVRNVSASYFDALKVPLVLGRGFRPNEDQLGGAAAVTLIAYRLWQERYSGIPGILGRQIRLNNVPFTIVGVAGSGATDRPIGGGLPAVWVPHAATPLERVSKHSPRRFEIVPADQDAAEGEEGLMDIGAPFVADGEASKAM